jgi:hypothetical protein
LPKKEVRLLESETRRLFLSQPAGELRGATSSLRGAGLCKRCPAQYCTKHVQVPLDGTSNKSEDYQIDIGRRCSNALDELKFASS